MIAALARLPAQRLARSRRSWVSVAGWTLVSLLAAWWARGGGASGALLGIYATFALPLLTFGLVGAVARGDSFSAAGRSLVTLGASGPLVSLIHAAVAIAASGVAGGALGALVAVIGHGAADPSVGRDLVTCSWVGALGGAAYGGLFSLGSCFGPRGAGRSVLLVLNWLAGGGVLGAVFPYAHVRSLLGGDPAGGLSHPQSEAALVGICLACAVVASWRGRR